MTDSEIMKMCKRLAGKFRSQIMYEDLVSEGVLACYEAKAKGKENPAHLFRQAKQRMYNYLNLKSNVISLPSSSRAKKLSRDRDKKFDGMKEETRESLSIALNDDTVDFEDWMSQVPDHSALYEDVEYYRHLMSVAQQCLAPEEFALIKMRYVDDLSQHDVAKQLGVSQSTVSLLESKYLQLIRESL